MPETRTNRDARWVRHKAIIREAKNRPCMDCGNQYHFCAMQFDHRPGEVKHQTPPSLRQAIRYNWSLTAILAEIAKCDVVCAVCHAIRTYKRLIQGDIEENV